MLVREHPGDFLWTVKVVLWWMLLVHVQPSEGQSWPVQGVTSTSQLSLHKSLTVYNRGVGPCVLSWLFLCYSQGSDNYYIIRVSFVFFEQNTVWTGRRPIIMMVQQTQCVHIYLDQWVHDSWKTFRAGGRVKKRCHKLAWVRVERQEACK